MDTFLRQQRKLTLETNDQLVDELAQANIIAATSVCWQLSSHTTTEQLCCLGNLLCTTTTGKHRRMKEESLFDMCIAGVTSFYSYKLQHTIKQYILTYQYIHLQVLLTQDQVGFCVSSCDPLMKCVVGGFSDILFCCTGSFHAFVSSALNGNLREFQKVLLNSSAALATFYYYHR